MKSDELYSLKSCWHEHERPVQPAKVHPPHFQKGFAIRQKSCLFVQFLFLNLFLIFLFILIFSSKLAFRYLKCSLRFLFGRTLIWNDGRGRFIGSLEMMIWWCWKKESVKILNGRKSKHRPLRWVVSVFAATLSYDVGFSWVGCVTRYSLSSTFLLPQSDLYYSIWSFPLILIINDPQREMEREERRLEPDFSFLSFFPC